MQAAHVTSVTCLSKPIYLQNLLGVLCLIRNKFSSVGNDLSNSFLFAFLFGLFLLFLFFLSFAHSEKELCFPAPVQQSDWPFFFILFFFFFLSTSSPCPPPLGKSSSSSKTTTASEGASLGRVGTGLLGFHGFSKETILWSLSFLVLATRCEESPKNICFEAGRSLLKLWRGVLRWLLTLWLVFCFLLGGPEVEGV